VIADRDAAGLQWATARSVPTGVVPWTGVAVRFIVQGVDTGPIIAQRAVPVVAGDDGASLHTRIQVQEHELYLEVVDALARARITIDDEEVTWS